MNSRQRRRYRRAFQEAVRPIQKAIAASNASDALKKVVEHPKDTIDYALMQMWKQKGLVPDTFWISIRTCPSKDARRR